MGISINHKTIFGVFLIVGLYLITTTAAFSAVPYQTDIWVYQSTGWYGDNIYESPATTQILAKPAVAGTKVSYTIRLQNDGNQADTHWLKGSSVPAGWTVKLTEIASGINITNYVLGSGWGNRATGALRNILVEVTPDITVADNSVFNFSLTLISSNSGKKDTAMLATTAKIPIPDAQIYTDTGAFAGDDIYDIDLPVQSATRYITAGAIASFTIRVQNDGLVPGTFIIKGSGSITNWTLSYFEAIGSADITSAITGAGITTPILNPGEVYDIIIEVQSASTLYGFSKYDGQLAVSYGLNMDMVKFKAVIAPLYEADAMIYEADTASYLGDDIYNDTGAGQTITRNLISNGQTTYYVRVQNDGNTYDVLNITGPASSGSFIITYIDSFTHNNITADVTGAGWKTDAISPTGKRAIKVIVKASATASSGEQLGINITATSSNSSSQTDTVSAITTIAP